MFGLEKTAARVVAGIAIVAVIALLLFLHSCQQERTAKVEAKLATSQAAAASASGHDAVQSVGNVMGNEQATDTITTENGNVIDNAKGATVAVDPAVRSAGLVSLCRRKSYRDSHTACVQQPAPR
ncbi:MAG: hypothetical protein JWN66_4986 [Sphingomonas bacterium]|nr:hypothetical protein [Sphingomonas bacterium]